MWLIENNVQQQEVVYFGKRKYSFPDLKSEILTFTLSLGIACPAEWWHNFTCLFRISNINRFSIFNYLLLLNGLHGHSHSSEQPQLSNYLIHRVHVDGPIFFHHIFHHSLYPPKSFLYPLYRPNCCTTLLHQKTWIYHTRSVLPKQWCRLFTTDIQANPVIFHSSQPSSP